MSKERIHTIVQWGLATAVILLFCYFRLKPIYFQTVPYTYDQGRDFLKAEEIIRYTNPTFIGPTTGIVGLHHGVWWYYFLSSVFVIFNGWPQGFYYGMFFVALISAVLFYIFLKREFGFRTAFMFLLIVTISPYFIKISFFPGNNILAPPFVLLFIVSVYYFFKTKLARYLFLTAFSLGFIMETEFPFGLYIIPSFFILAFASPDFRKALSDKKNILYFLAGLIIPSVFRLLFNLKHGFSEVNSIIKFSLFSKPTNPQSITGTFSDRIDLFQSYYTMIFYEYSSTIAVALIFICTAALFMSFRHLKDYVKRTFVFLLMTVVFVFLLSLSNKDNFFWENYLEGIQYVLLFLTLTGIYALTKTKGYDKSVPILFVLFGTIAIIMFARELRNKKEIPYIGLRANVKTIDYLYSRVNKNDLCVKIYTPPVVPYTYTYLLSYYSKVKGFKWPANDFVQGSCWYIIDKDENKDRITDWRKKNIPEDAKRVHAKIMEDGTTVELWKK